MKLLKNFKLPSFR